MCCPVAGAHCGSGDARTHSLPVGGLAQLTAAPSSSQQVGGAAHAAWASVDHMLVDHRGAHVLVAQKLLDGANVLPPFQQMGGKEMADGVAARSLLPIEPQQAS